MIRIVIIDDDKFVCMSLQTILQADPELCVEATGTSAQDAMRLCAALRPDILLMDIRMPGMNGLEAGKEILTRFPDTKLLFLTTFSDDEYIIRALRLGAKGYLIKQNVEAVAPALKAVFSGQNVFGNEIAARLPSLMSSPPSPKALPEAAALTPRELEILSLLAEGRSNREIAEALYLSEGTIRNYLSAMLEKLHLRDRTQLAIFYYTGTSFQNP